MDQKLRTERRKLADLKAAEYNPRIAMSSCDVLSPHMSLCLPSSHTSPSLVTGSASACSSA